MAVQDRLSELGITLPPFNAPAANYAPAVKTGNLLFTAGQTTRYQGVMQHTGLVTDDNLQEAYEAARLCTLNALGVIEGVCGSLDVVVQVVKVTGFVLCDASFTQQAKVIDGATDLLVDIFGDAGRPARSAVGVSALPGSSMTEIELVVELAEE